ncbi:unnamed protein product [Brassicogethes aeneus]|uniref:TFIIS N-terminal domain-containing protein n=1 Tax=Brassicogethes aeneus TaxID=1431903 RepID=A0A9P0B122_BRAAE|nr:unnamed protein product [Brassicogethes aeneus]
MVEDKEKLVNLIRHYQDSLKRNYEKNNESKILYNIDKLYNLPIKVHHLEATGIGRTVNGLRKLGGEVGNAAKSLVAKWKEIVLVEEVDEKESVSAETSKESIESCNEKDDEEDDEDEEKLTINEPNYDLETSNDRKYNKNHEISKSHHSRKEEKSERHKKRRKSTSGSEDKESDDERHRKIRKNHKKREHESSESEDTKEEGKIIKKYSKEETIKSKKRRDLVDEEPNFSKSKPIKQRHSDKENNEKERVKKHKSSKTEHMDSDEENDKGREKKHKSSKTDRMYSDEENDKGREKKHKPSKSDRIYSDEENEKGREKKHKSSKSEHMSSDEENNKGRDKKHTSSKSREVEKSSRPSSSRSNKHREDKHKSKSVDKENEELKMKEERSSHKKDTKSKHREEKKEKVSDKPKKDEKERKTKEQNFGKTEEKNSKKHKSSKSSKEEKSTSTKLPVDKVINGIDSGSGASFAEALGMCVPIKKVISSSTSSKKKVSSNLASKNDASSSGHSSYSNREKQEPYKAEIPKLLIEPYEPVDLNISSLLPSITPNYRPLGNAVAVDAPFKRTLTDYEALTHVITTKNQRTKVYSGNKVTNGIVPSLFELCVRILQDNLDALEYTGGVPYSILKPILDKANPDQLYMMEHHNPYLIEDTDELWQLHCNKEFRLQKREEMESWRDMYMRCLDEREAKLKALTANIKQSQDKSTPVRQTKLAYVDGVVKPPRNIIRKQAKNGTVFDKKPSQTPSSRLNSLATAGGESVPNPGSRASTMSRSSSSSSAMKPKKAPLMAKTLSFMKNRFKR